MRWLAAHLVVALLAMSALACSNLVEPASPEVSITTVPEAGTGGPDRVKAIAGRAQAVDSGDRIVLYARSGVWWVQPLAAEPFTPIAADGTWRSSTHLGTEYAALLVAPGFLAEATLDRLPDVGGLVRAATVVPGTGTQTAPATRTITFSGYEWEVRDAPSDRGGQNYYDARNVRLDGAGRLHLRLERRDGRWTGAEVSLKRSLGYGTYLFAVGDTSGMDPSAVLGLVTWDDGAASQNHRELDVEISQWGDVRNDNAQFVVQPYYVPANVRRFVAPAGPLLHSFRWEPGRAQFRSTRGRSGPVVAEHAFASGVPVPGNERVRMHLYAFGFTQTPLSHEVEVVIERFQYLP
ncbi:hypothetical protein [Luteitalea sp.]